ncbi:MAG: DUF3772 domain-containing protein [Xanthobacteraceae bacterium]|nr:DUF3772 domain-containing protein [Xanthobacteraceae bacterium]
MARNANAGAGGKCRAKGILALAILALALGFAGHVRADDQLQAMWARLEPMRMIFQQTEADLNRSGLREEDLAGMRNVIEPLRAELRGRIEEIEPRYAETESRLKELGPAPGKDAPPEDAKVAASRNELAALLSEIDGTLRQTRLLALRADQIADRIDRRRRAIYTERLFERSDSVLDPTLWISAVKALPGEGRALATLLSDWKDHATARAGYGSIAAALLTIVAVIGGILFLRRMIRQRTDGRPAAPEAAPPTRLRTVCVALRDAALDAAAIPLAALAAIEILSAFDLLPLRMRDITDGLIAAILLLSVGRALGRAVLAPGVRRRRLPAIDDEAADRLYRLASGAVVVVGFAAFLNVMHRALAAPLALTVVTSALMALAIVALLVRTLVSAHRAMAAGAEDGLPHWIRLPAWIVVATIAVALATGYVGFAAFVAGRLVNAAIVFGTLYLFLVLVEAFFAESLVPESPRRRGVAATLGLRTKNLELGAILLSGLLRALLIVVAIFLVVGTWGTSVVDIVSTLDRVTFDIEIGRTKILLVDVLAAVAMLFIGLVITRIIQGWIAQIVLPRTDLEPGLQNSIATIVGYIGAIIAGSLALGRLGLNLENVALVAGALSVGIGFGLQSIVSNFVSGLILLTERMIRVGDTIVVKGEEGVVRRISVRATEIETFERSTVLVPNSDLITGVVKNWTRMNTTGRIVVPVGVSYDADPDRVRDILFAAAGNLPQVLKTPAPRVLFVRFGDSALEFELRCVVDDVRQALNVKSDLHFAILRQFREAGIEIPYPQREVRVRDDSTENPIEIRKPSRNKPASGDV